MGFQNVRESTFCSTNRKKIMEIEDTILSLR